MKHNETKRILSIDVLRSVAIICVVLCHATEATYYLNVDFMQQQSVASQLFALTSFTIGRLGVPIFIFISGYLLLSRKYDEKASIHFWKKNLCGLLLTTEIWIVFYNLFLAIYNQQSLNIETLIQNMLFLNYVSLSHMWYMPMILGMYIFIPFVANAVQSMKKEILYFPLCIAGSIIFILPIINLLVSISGRVSLNSLLTIDFSGGAYGILLITGYLFKQGILKNIKTKTISIIGICLFIGTVYLQYYAYVHGQTYNVWYNFGSLVMCSATIFELGTRIKQIPYQKWITNLAKCSFGIFLIHNPVLLIITRNIHLGGGITSKGNRIIYINLYYQLGNSQYI